MAQKVVVNTSMGAGEHPRTPGSIEVGAGENRKSAGRGDGENPETPWHGSWRHPRTPGYIEVGAGENPKTPGSGDGENPKTPWHGSWRHPRTPGVIVIVLVTKIH